MHWDIKLENILLDTSGKVKICDFGVSIVHVPGEIIHDQCGTPAYLAPEVFKGLGHTGFKSDIWSAGVTLYSMLNGTIPFKCQEIHEL